MSKNCKVTGCQNPADGAKGWPFCTACMINTVRRILDVKGIWEAHRTDKPTDPAVYEAMKETIEFIKENADALVQTEKDIWAARRGTMN